MCERVLYFWTDLPRVNEISTCEWNKTSTCEWILDKRLKFCWRFLHVLTGRKETYIMSSETKIARVRARAYVCICVLKSD